MTSRKEVVDTFWDLYQEGGTAEALQYIIDESKGETDHIKDSMEYILMEGRGRDIDIIQFIQEMGDLIMEDANGSTTGVDNGGTELSVDSGIEDPSPEDEVLPTETRDADAEDQPADESCPISEGQQES